MYREDVVHTSDQIRSVAQSGPTLCDPMNRSTPGLSIHHQLPEFTQTHDHRVIDAIQPPHPLSSPVGLFLGILFFLMFSCLWLFPFFLTHGLQPTRFLCSWNFPGKNTGVGCHFLLQCMKAKSESEVVQSFLSPSDPMDCSLPGSSNHGSFQARVLEWGAITFSNSISSTWQKYESTWISRY